MAMALVYFITKIKRRRMTREITFRLRCILSKTEIYQYLHKATEIEALKFIN